MNDQKMKEIVDKIIAISEEYGLDPKGVMRLYLVVLGAVETSAGEMSKE